MNFISAKKGSTCVAVNMDNVAYVEPHKDNPQRIVIHFHSGLFIVVNMTMDQFVTKTALMGAMQ